MVLPALWNFLSGKRLSYPLLFLWLFIGTVSSSYAQSEREMEKRKASLQSQVATLKKEIAAMEKIILQTTSKKNLTKKEVEALKAKIKSKEAQIGNFRKEIANLEKDIKATEGEIVVKESQEIDLKEKYAYILREIYQNIVSAKSSELFLLAEDKAFITNNYLSKISDYRMKQAILVKSKIIELEEKKETLEASKKQTEQQLDAENKQKNLLAKEKQNKDKEIATLTDKEKRIKTQIEAKNKAYQKLNASIQKIIEEQIRIQQQKAQQQQKAKPAAAKEAVTSKAETYLSPQELALSLGFASNQGKLPWPVAKGKISGAFGKQEHPTVKNVFIENNGIDFKTMSGTSARSVFEGTVISIFNLPTTHTCIIIKHGEYFTVYSNILNASVKVGDKVATKQAIGSVYTDPEDNSTKLHMELWKGKEKINPALWLVSAN
jgi:septal ring factor EnvC (AmiA/AmiB activator)